jgi:hypothetical protein
MPGKSVLTGSPHKAGPLAFIGVANKKLLFDVIRNDRILYQYHGAKLIIK